MRVLHRVERGLWQRVLPGVFVTHGGTPPQTSWPGLRSPSPATVLPCPAAMPCSASVSALRRRGRSRLLVLTPLRNAQRSAGFVVVRRTHLSPIRPVQRGGLALAPIPRAVIDTCMGLRSQGTVRSIVAEVVQRGRCSAAELGVELARSATRDSAFCRAAIREVGAGAWSAPECEVGELLRAAELPAFEQNVDVYDAAGTGWRAAMWCGGSSGPSSRWTVVRTTRIPRRGNEPCSGITCSQPPDGRCCTIRPACCVQTASA